MGSKQSKNTPDPCLLSQWQCKKCNTLNEMTDTQCKSCSITCLISQWRCEECNTSNEMTDFQCVSCSVDKQQLSPLSQIMHQQELLFKGYFRTEVLNTLSVNFESKLMTNDIIDLCHKYVLLRRS